MHKAVKDGDEEQVSRLLASGADVNEKDSLNRTALHLAAWKGNAKLIATLLAAKADVLALAQDGYSALHFAVNSGSLPSVEELMRKSMNAQLKLKLNKNKRTALHLAASKNNLPIVQLLLSKGADPLALTKSGETPADLAVDHAVIDAIVEKCKQDVERQKEDLLSLDRRPVPSCEEIPSTTPAPTASAGPGPAQRSQGPPPMVAGGSAAVGASAAPANEAEEDSIAIEVRPLKRKMKPLYAPPKIQLGHLGDEEDD